MAALCWVFCFLFFFLHGVVMGGVKRSRGYGWVKDVECECADQVSLPTLAVWFLPKSVHVH